MRNFKNFKIGLIVVLLLGLISWFLTGIINFITNALNNFLLLVLPDQWIFPFSGLILAIILTWLLGKLLRSKSVDKIILKIFRKIPIISKGWNWLKNIQEGIEEMKNFPCVLVEYRGPGRLDLAFLRKVEKIPIKSQGKIIKKITKCWIYIPSANNPTSGSIPAVDPKLIKAVVKNDFNEILTYILTCTISRPKNGWKLEKFQLENFIEN